jgi:hypothetical protein
MKQTERIQTANTTNPMYTYGEKVEMGSQKVTARNL